MTSTIKYLPSIVEQGTSGNWTYRKWSDGTAECWGAVETPKISNSVVGGFYGGVASNIALPSGLFSEIPRVLLNIYDYGSGMFFGTVRAVTASAFNIQALRSDNVSSTAKANVYAIGKWR